MLAKRLAWLAMRAPRNLAESTIVNSALRLTAMSDACCRNERIRNDIQPSEDHLNLLLSLNCVPMPSAFDARVWRGSGHGRGLDGPELAVLGKYCVRTGKPRRFIRPIIFAEA